MFSSNKTWVVFLTLAIPFCFGNCKYPMKGLITEYMDIFIKKQ